MFSLQVICVLFSIHSTHASLSCPSGSILIGDINDSNDILGCGLEGCNPRYLYGSIEACESACISRDDCFSYSWAPLNGDTNHQSKTVCTLYNSDEPTNNWGPEQVMCEPISQLKCASHSILIGDAYAMNNIGGCGLEGCDSRYKYADVEECEIMCIIRNDCISYTWTSVNGDKNHAGVSVCTLYNDDVPNQQSGPDQIMCKPILTTTTAAATTTTAAVTTTAAATTSAATDVDDSDDDDSDDDSDDDDGLTDDDGDDDVGVSSDDDSSSVEAALSLKNEEERVHLDRVNGENGNDAHRIYTMEVDQSTLYNLYAMMFIFLMVNVTVYCCLNKKEK